MKSCLSILICVAVFAGTYTTGYATTYTGSLNYAWWQRTDQNEIFSEGDWIIDPITFSWEVTDEAVNSLKEWKYTYTFDNSILLSDVDSIIIEASEETTAADFVGLTGATLDGEVTYQTLSSNPGLPDTIYGIKLKAIGEGFLNNNWTFSFYSDRDPTWGDFYARDSNSISELFGYSTYAYNYNDTNGVISGFTANDVDPTDPASDGSVAFSILRPNSVPEPATLVMMIISGWMIVRKYRK
jgi:hypothetical protein